MGSVDPSTQTDLNHDRIIPPPAAKTDQFELDEELNDAWTLDPYLADYANKYI